MEKNRNRFKKNFFEVILSIIFWIFNITSLINFAFIAIYMKDFVNENLLFINVYSFFLGLLLLINILIKLLLYENKLSVIRYSMLDIFSLGLLILQNSTGIFFFWIYLLGRQIILIVRKISASNHKSFYFQLTRNPAFFFILSFIFTIFIGTILLMLPLSTVDNGRLSFIDALFTSTSATCVTGLVVESTGHFFSQFGQIVIIILIQIGGLGIMTISTAFAVILGQKLTMRSENMMQNVVGESNRIDMLTLVRNILIVTFLVEIIGAILLYLTFYHDPQISSPIFNSVFHSISAFCNAGFSLYDNSFESFYDNINITFTISALIIIGGLGFSVMTDLKKNIFSGYHPSRLSAHTKLVVITTAFLIFGGFVLYFFTEYNSTMSNFNSSERLLASFFQSVTTRTAGFNTISNGDLSDSSYLVTLLLMFIGASPGSTGGGVKTTALAVLFITVLSIIKSSRNVTAFQRKISIETIKRVLALISISLTVLAISFLVLLAVKPPDISTKTIIFEAVSAFGTVGLSMGITSGLNSVSKLIIILLMFFGRVGPLTIIFALSKKTVNSDIDFTEAKLGIG